MYKLNIDFNKYSKLKDVKNINEELLRLIDIGYNITYNTNIDSSLKILSIQNENLFNILNNNICKIDSKFFGQNKGIVGEQSIEEILKNKFKNVIYKNTSKIPHNGDFELDYNNIKILLEIKTYSQIVSCEQIEKLYFDMKHTNINYGIFISNYSNITKHPEFDIDIFSHNSQYYFVIFISHFIENIQKLNIALKILYSISNVSFSKTVDFTISLEKKILSMFQEFNSSIKQISKIIDKYKKMEQNINLDLLDLKLELYKYNDDVCLKLNNLLYNVNSILKNDNDNNFNKLKNHKLKKDLTILFKFKNITLSDDLLSLNNGFKIVILNDYIKIFNNKITYKIFNENDLKLLDKFF